MTDDYLDLRLEAFLEQLATAGRAPGGGSAAALTIAFAARLVAMVARCSRETWNEAGGVMAQATAIGERAVALATTDAAAWEDALAALRAAEAATEDAAGELDLERKLEAAAAAPLEIASLGADAVALAALACENGDPTYRADAAAGAALAAGAARAAAHLVRVNLGVHRSDPRLARALASERTASEVAQGLVETGS